MGRLMHTRPLYRAGEYRFRAGPSSMAESA